MNKNTLTGDFNSLLSLQSCYGCGVCAAVCPADIICLREDLAGFYRPYVDEPDKCIKCGICERSCAVIFAPRSSEGARAEAYAAWAHDDAERLTSTSGGVASSLARSVVSDGGIACGAAYNVAKHRTEHILCDNEEGISKTKGSKYMQSHTVDAFRKLQIANAQRKIVVSAPCQTASLANYLDMKGARSQYLLVDFFCHGVPSLLLWDAYLRDQGKNLNNIDHIRFRTKKNGWKDSYIISASAQGVEIYSSGLKEGDMFYKFFLGNRVLNIRCYSCPFRQLSSSADIRVGDFWADNYQDEAKGVSALIVLTDKGRAAIADCEGLVLHPQPTDKVTSRQLSTDLGVPPYRDEILKGLCEKRELKYLYYRYVLFYRIKRLPSKLLSMILNRQ